MSDRESAKRKAEDNTSGDDGKRRRSGNLVAPEKEAAPPPITLDDGHFNVRLGENITPRFKILAKLGEGTFAQVLEVWDRSVRQRVAAKVVKAIRKYRHAARVEVDLLERVRKADPTCVRSGVIQLVHHFEYHGHVIMIFPKYGMSVFDFMRRNDYRGYPLEDVRRIAAQMVSSIAFLHELGMIHTDLKPENLLFLDSSYTKDEEGVRKLNASDIVVIDMGSAILSHQRHSTVITTRHYRPPEVILQLGWSFPADMYAIGCILAELVTGEALYQTHETYEHLAMMCRVMGRVPSRMVAATRDEEMRNYLKGGMANFPRSSDSRESIRAVRRCKPVRDLFENLPAADRAEFLDLVLNLLSYESENRFTAKQALRHPFIRKFIDAERERTRGGSSVATAAGDGAAAGTSTTSSHSSSSSSSSNSNSSSASSSSNATSAASDTSSSSKPSTAKAAAVGTRSSSGKGSDDGLSEGKENGAERPAASGTPKRVMGSQQLQRQTSGSIVA